MKTIRVLNRQRRVVAVITWQANGEVTLDRVDEGLRSPLTQFLAEISREGAPLRSGRQVIEAGQPVYVEELRHVQPDAPEFPAALTDAIRMHSFAGQRLFALLTPTEQEASDAQQ